MSNMKRVLETLADLKVGVSVEQAFLEGVYEGLDLSSELLDDLLADEAAHEALDNLTDAEFEDAAYEVATLDEDGDDAFYLGFYFNEQEAREDAAKEAFESGSLVMFRILDRDNNVVFTQIYGGQF